MGSGSGGRLPTFRSLAGNRTLLRVLAGYSLFVLTEYSVWIAMLVYAYSRVVPRSRGWWRWRSSYPRRRWRRWRLAASAGAVSADSDTLGAETAGPDAPGNIAPGPGPP